MYVLPVVHVAGSVVNVRLECVSEADLKLVRYLSVPLTVRGLRRAIQYLEPAATLTDVIGATFHALTIGAVITAWARSVPGWPLVVST